MMANTSMATITATMPPIKSRAVSSSLFPGKTFLLLLILDFCVVFIVVSFLN